MILKLIKLTLILAINFGIFMLSVRCLSHRKIAFFSSLLCLR